MSNIAIVAEGALNGNELFSPLSGRDGNVERFTLLRHELEKEGKNVCGTADTFDEKDISVLIFHNVHSEFAHVLRVVKANPLVRLVYIPNEPYIISPMHHESILPLLPFDAVLTWNDKIADRYPNVVKCNIGQPIIDVASIPNLPFADRKLIACIYTNKSSQDKKSLYSMRLDAIKFFNSKPSGMDLYGRGWENSDATYIRNSFRGACESKKEILKSFKFSIAYENVTGLPGLITEKIFDCFAAGTVPIYFGAPNIQDYIPEACFIDFRKFENYDTLYNYLVGMTEAEHSAYLKAARDFVESPANYKFTSAGYVDVVTSQLLKIERMPPLSRSVWQMKRQLMRLMFKSPALFSEFRHFRRMIYVVATIW